MKKVQNTDKLSIQDLEDLNRSDKVAYLLKAIGGSFPFGSFLAETIVTIIPNQKQDRIITYVKELVGRINDLPNEILDGLFDNPKFQALLEETIEQSARATTQQRYEYLASIVINGISDEKIELEESEYILSLFKQLTDVQIIWLNYYYLKRFRNSHDYFEKHKNILKKKEVYLKGSFEDYKQVALQRGNIEQLVRLGLVREETEYDRMTKELKIDSSTKKLKVTNTVITDLGKALLLHIGIFEDYNKSAN